MLDTTAVVAGFVTVIAGVAFVTTVGLVAETIDGEMSGDDVIFVTIVS